MILGRKELGMASLVHFLETSFKKGGISKLKSFPMILRNPKLSTKTKPQRPRGGMACSVVVRVVHSKVALPAMGLGIVTEEIN